MQIQLNQQLNKMEINRQLIQINQLPTAKEEIQEFGEAILKALDSGIIKASDILLRFKGISKVEEYIKGKLTKLAVEEISKFPQGTAEMNGATFQTMEAGISYDFSLCGDPIHTELMQTLEKAKTSIKKREDFLKGINGHETIVIEGTGEIVTIYPPSKKSSTTIKITIK